MRAAAVIPARGGSTRIPRKNIKEFHGYPIIAYSIKTAQESGLFDRIVVSTDDDEMADVAHDYDAEVLYRPAELAENEVGTQSVMRHAICTMPSIDMACCIYATAPMLDIMDLRAGKEAIQRGHTYAFAVGQDPLHDAGQFYWGWAWAFRKGISLITPYTAMIPIPAERDCDINTMDDWSRAEAMYKQLEEA